MALLLLLNLLVQSPECLERTYSARHLAAHPSQPVIKLELVAPQSTLSRPGSEVRLLRLFIRDGEIHDFLLRCPDQRCREASVEPLGAEDLQSDRPIARLARNPQRTLLHLPALDIVSTTIDADIYRLDRCADFIAPSCGQREDCLLYAASLDTALDELYTAAEREKVAVHGGAIFVSGSGEPGHRVLVQPHAGACAGPRQGLPVLGFQNGQLLVATKRSIAVLDPASLNAARGAILLIEREGLKVLRRFPAPSNIADEVSFDAGLDADGRVLIAQGERCVSISRDGTFESAGACELPEPSAWKEEELAALRKATDLAGDRIVIREFGSQLVVYALSYAC